MKKVTSADSLILGSIVGEMPFQEAWPQLWVKNDLDYDRALQLIDEANTLNESPAAAWRCKHCRSENEGQFRVQFPSTH